MTKFSGGGDLREGGEEGREEGVVIEGRAEEGVKKI